MLVTTIDVVDHLLRKAIKDAKDIGGPFSQDAEVIQAALSDFIKSTLTREVKV